MRQNRMEPGKLEEQIKVLTDLSKKVSLKKHVYLEQIVYLVILKMIQEGIFNEKNKKQNNDDKSYIEQINRYTWDYFIDKKEDDLIEFLRNDVFPFYANSDSNNWIIDEVFNNAKFHIEKSDILERILSTIDSISFIDLNEEESSFIMEKLVNELLEIRDLGLGQYSTPRSLAKLITNLIAPKTGMKVLDPSCGTGTLLIEIFKHIRQKDSKSNISRDLFGIDISRSMVRLSLFNFLLRGETNVNIRRADFLRNQGGVSDNIINQKFDLIISDPPLKGFVPIEELRSEFDPITSQTDQLYLQEIVRLLDENGIGVVMLPDSFLVSRTKGVKYLKMLLFKESYRVLSVISLPRGLYSNISISLNLIVFSKRKSTDESKVWFYEFDETISKSQADSDFDVAARDLLELWNAYRSSGYFTPPGINSESTIEKENSPKYWWASYKQLRENDFDLTFNLHKPKKREVPKKSVKELLGEISQLNKQVEQAFSELKKELEG
ncbi:MAG: N-6 DNA methylase [Balneolaceae bacterium]